MDSFEWNKIAGAVLATVLFILVVTAVSESMFEVEPPEEPAYVVEGVEEAAPPPIAEEPAAPALPDFVSAISAASAENGAAIAERCAVCHGWDKGGPNMIGPNLFGIVGRARAGAPGFAYSAALRAKGGEWSYAELFLFLAQPAVFAPGTTMAFAGIPREEDLLDVIAFMRSWADAPAESPTQAQP